MSTNIEVIDFQTPKVKERKKVTTTLTLVGREYEVVKPKDAALFFFSGAMSETANDADVWFQVLKLIDEIFDPVGRKEFYERACDREDPLTAGALFDALEQLSERWTAKSAAQAGRPVVIEAVPDSVPDDLPILHIQNDELDLDLKFYPPKDIILGITSAALGVGVDDQSMVWFTTLFLDASLPLSDRRMLRRRLHTRQGDLELDDLLGMVQTLTERWYPESEVGNRRARRAAASRKRKGGTTTPVKVTTKLNPPAKK
ncbi:hypothetical protein [Nocardiopsis synnemataformans]|uniref:hypothetical protein n=1 Tax=Nocardiopsis synnemataformans TaxID=61305 RepID=UPI003EC083BA